jgi:hypothetical protein
MVIGKGTLILRSGRQLPVEYQFGGAFDDTRLGYVLCDTSGVDPAALWERLRLVCDDGNELVVAVMHAGDRYLAVTGRVTGKAAEADCVA